MKQSLFTAEGSETTDNFFLKKFIYLFIFGCIGSSLLGTGFL